VRSVDEQRGMEDEVRTIVDAPSGEAGLRRFLSLQARMNPGIWAIARALDAVRRRDEAVERSWPDRLANPLRGWRTIIGRIADDGVLRDDLDPDAAADLVWSVTSLRAWEDLTLDGAGVPTTTRRASATCCWGGSQSRGTAPAEPGSGGAVRSGRVQLPYQSSKRAPVMRS
jgi:hypothetical protein